APTSPAPCADNGLTASGAEDRHSQDDDDDDCGDDGNGDEHCRDREDFTASGAEDGHSQDDDDDCDDDDGDDEHCRDNDDDCDDRDDKQSESVSPKTLNAPSALAAAPEAPKPPVGLTAAAGESSVTLGWEPVEGAGYYNVYRSDVSGVGHEGMGSSKGTSFVDADVLPGVTYYYIVTTVGLDKTQSRDSKEVAATVEAPAPTVTPSPAVPADDPPDEKEDEPKAAGPDEPVGSKGDDTAEPPATEAPD
ncbi:MAG: hypothetical protein WBO97_13425, partial [Tepidiformaceae bacterium]